MLALARPYARAAFEYAQQQQAIAIWSEQLKKLAQLSQNTTVSKLLQNPNYSGHQQVEILLALLENKNLNANLENFIKVLAENDRLNLLPDIATLFDQLVAEHQKVLHGQVMAAIKLDEPFLQQLNLALNKKLGKTVQLETHIDPSLIGGVVVRVGDLVLDGSVRGELQRLRQTVTIF